MSIMEFLRRERLKGRGLTPLPPGGLGFLTAGPMPGTAPVGYKAQNPIGVAEVGDSGDRRGSLREIRNYLSDIPTYARSPFRPGGPDIVQGSSGMVIGPQDTGGMFSFGSVPEQAARYDSGYPRFLETIGFNPVGSGTTAPPADAPPADVSSSINVGRNFGFGSPEFAQEQFEGGYYPSSGFQDLFPEIEDFDTITMIPHQRSGDQQREFEVPAVWGLGDQQIQQSREIVSRQVKSPFTGRSRTVYENVYDWQGPEGYNWESIYDDVEPLFGLGLPFGTTEDGTPVLGEGTFGATDDGTILGEGGGALSDVNDSSNVLFEAKSGGLVGSYKGGGLIEGYQEGGLADLGPSPGMVDSFASPEMEAPPVPDMTGITPEMADMVIKNVQDAAGVLREFENTFGADMLEQVTGYSSSGVMSDGMSDSIPGSIEGDQDVLLSEGEYIVPAREVAALGNGSTEAGGRALDGMVQDIRAATTGTTEQMPAIDPVMFTRGMA
jgi:hypothetical protein